MRKKQHLINEFLAITSLSCAIFALIAAINQDVEPFRYFTAISTLSGALYLFLVDE